MAADNLEEYVVLTPKGKTANSTILMVERCARKAVSSDIVAENNAGDSDKNGKVHVAGGEHQGIIINKTAYQESGEISKADLQLEFRVYLVNAQTGAHTQESRTLRFWFKEAVVTNERSTIAQHFFKDLVSPTEFPRDYVGFIKKIMKLVQHCYPTIKKIEIEMRALQELDKMPERPLSADETSMDSHVELSGKKLLDIIESSYPNPITIHELAIRYGWEADAIKSEIQNLQKKGLVKAIDHGAFTRITQDDVDIQVVKHMPTIVSSKQPTIAIITAQYCEKVAVDALIDNKETYVRYTTVGDYDEDEEQATTLGGRITEKTIFTTRFGESNVYTLGNIGSHRVVCTKLPTMGRTTEAMIAAGNTTTRLLGTFQKVDYVILVGVGGGVPHYTDYDKHVRLGDVVISYPAEGKKYVYTFCKNAQHNPETEGYEFETKEYSPNNLILQKIASKIKIQSDEDPENTLWLNYMEEAMTVLEKEKDHNFARPSMESDKLYMSIGERAIIEVAHPVPLNPDNRHCADRPRVHAGVIASGMPRLSKDEQLRQAFALYAGAVAFDSEFDSVVIESIVGNCRDSFAVVRGIADYRDGTRRTAWQPYAALAAAAVAKAIVAGMPEHA